jgi:hypothetical protein
LHVPLGVGDGLVLGGFEVGALLCGGAPVVVRVGVGPAAVVVGAGCDPVGPPDAGGAAVCREGVADGEPEPLSDGDALPVCRGPGAWAPVELMSSEVGVPVGATGGSSAMPGGGAGPSEPPEKAATVNSTAAPASAVPPIPSTSARCRRARLERLRRGSCAENASGSPSAAPCDARREDRGGDSKSSGRASTSGSCSVTASPGGVDRSATVPQSGHE